MNDKIIEAVKQYLGKPYVWGGESDDEGGYDCSGLVYAALKDAGYSVGRGTAQSYFTKYKDNAIDITRASTEKGALLFFGKSTSSITHVAIADGNGYMYESIGTSKNTKKNPGKGVTLSKVTRRKDLVAVCTIEKEIDTYYYPKYAGSSGLLDVILKTIGAPYGNVTKRRPVANINGITDYAGTYSQNVKLIKLAKAGTLRRV